MPADFVHADHGPVADALARLRDRYDSLRDELNAGTTAPSDGVDTVLTDASVANDDEAAEQATRGDDSAETTQDANQTFADVAEDAAHAIDSVDTDTHLSSGGAAPSGGASLGGYNPGGSSPATQLTSAQGGSPLGSLASLGGDNTTHQAQQQQQQQMQAAQQQRQQAMQAQQQWQQQRAAIQQFNRQQQQAWQQAMQARQAQMNQLNQRAQQQAVQQTANDPVISADEVEDIISGLYDDEANQVEGYTDESGQPATRELPAADVDGLDTGDVSVEKTNASQMSEDEVRAVINEACDLNGVSNDPQVRNRFINTWLEVARNESGFSPNAANGWDSNAVGATAADGYPAQSSRGMWQTIPETFAANHVAGTSTSIYDPLASCAASIRYTMQQYGVDTNGNGIDAFAAQRGIDPDQGGTHGAYMGY